MNNAMREFLQAVTILFLCLSCMILAVNVYDLKSRVVALKQVQDLSHD